MWRLKHPLLQLHGWQYHGDIGGIVCWDFTKRCSSTCRKFSMTWRPKAKRNGDERIGNLAIIRQRNHQLWRIITCIMTQKYSCSCDCDWANRSFINVARIAHLSVSQVSRYSRLTRWPWPTPMKETTAERTMLLRTQNSWPGTLFWKSLCL